MTLSRDMRNAIESGDLDAVKRLVEVRARALHAAASHARPRGLRRAATGWIASLDTKIAAQSCPLSI